jgi:hypothetical protein
MQAFTHGTVARRGVVSRALCCAELLTSAIVPHVWDADVVAGLLARGQALLTEVVVGVADSWRSWGVVSQGRAARRKCAR